MVARRSDIRLVVIEAGWLNKSNWHIAKLNKFAASKSGKDIGANHEVGRKIVEMCEYLKLPFELVRPTQTKVTKEYFGKITGIKDRTNQDQRDAMMLVFGRS